MVLVARREDKLKEVMDEIESAGGEAILVVADVSKVCTCTGGGKETAHVGHGVAQHHSTCKDFSEPRIEWAEGEVIM